MATSEQNDCRALIVTAVATIGAILVMLVVVMGWLGLVVGIMLPFLTVMLLVGLSYSGWTRFEGWLRD